MGYRERDGYLGTQGGWFVIYSSSYFKYDNMEALVVGHLKSTSCSILSWGGKTYIIYNILGVFLKLKLNKFLYFVH